MDFIDYTCEPVTIEVEAVTLEEFMKHCDYNKSKVTEMLGGNRGTTRRRVEQLKQGKQWLVQVHRDDKGRIACFTWFNGDA